jgi:hypothetical protein
MLACALVCLPAFSQNTHSVTVSWTAPTAGGTVNGFNVYRGTVSGGPYTLMNASPIPALTLSYVDTAGLVENTKYFYVVTATGPGGESAQSLEASALIPFSAPSAPTNVKAIAK